jgi:hypothetical protein
MAHVTLTVVANELEAEMLCGELRANGIACEHRSAGIFADRFGSAVTGAVFGEAAQTEAWSTRTISRRLGSSFRTASSGSVA